MNELDYDFTIQETSRAAISGVLLFTENGITVANEVLDFEWEHN